jgi:amino acid transporter
VNKMGFWSVASIGVGGMVGGGIFAVLGLAVQMAKGGVPLAFFLSGVIALLTAYAYARLSVTYPSQGGTVEYLNQAFGPGLLTGGLNILLWLSYIVMLSLYAYAFGSYGKTFFPAGVQAVWKHVLISTVVVGLTVLNVVGAKAVGRAEKWIVGIKVAILLLFIAFGLWSVQLQRLTPASWADPVSLFAGGMIIFLAYEGFELIANTAQDVRTPHKTLPRAFYASVGFVIALYVPGFIGYGRKLASGSDRRGQRLCSGRGGQTLSGKLGIHPDCRCGPAVHRLRHQRDVVRSRPRQLHHRQGRRIAGIPRAQILEPTAGGPVAHVGSDAFDG